MMSKIIQVLVFVVMLFNTAIYLKASNTDVKNVENVFLQFNSHKIHYALSGNKASDKTLVFVHGWSSNSEVWKHQVNSFHDYKVIAIDLPGHGQSSKDIDADYNIELLVNSINAVLKNENISKAFVFGHSMGFAITEVFALKYPEKTVGIGSIDGAHFEVESDKKSQKEWIDYNNMFAESMNQEKGREDFINALFLPETPEDFKSDILKSCKNTPLVIGKKIIASMSNDMSFWQKRTTNIPCLVVHSPVYQLTEDYKKSFIKMYPEAVYHEINNVSHFLMLEIPDKLNEMIREYLQKVY